jgi:hypothetical protein
MQSDSFGRKIVFARKYRSHFSAFNCGVPTLQLSAKPLSLVYRLLSEWFFPSHYAIPLLATQVHSHRPGAARLLSSVA